MSEMFVIFLENLKEMHNKFTNNIKNLYDCDIDQINKFTQQADTNVTEMQKLVSFYLIKKIKIMDVQLNSVTIEEKNKKSYLLLKKDVQESNKILKKTMEDCENRKKIYMISVNNKSPVREKLIEMSETNNIDDYSYKQFEKLDKATNNILDIESRGTIVSKELKNHTETMLRVNNNLEDMNGELGSSSNLIKKMLRREQRNKLIIVIFSITLIIIFLTILTMRLIGGKNESTSNLHQNSFQSDEISNFNS